MNTKKKTKKRIGKVNPILYAFVYFVIKWQYKLKYKLNIDKTVAKTIKGPAIVLAKHMSDKDHILSALTLYPVRPTYVISEHFIHNPSTARLLKLMPVITKKMFTADLSCVIKIMRAVKEENAVIVIFPEGRLSCYGHTLPLADGTAELIKKLGVNLYVWSSEGAYLTFPKWRDKGDDRIGKINTSVKLLMTADEVKCAEVSNIREIAEKAILHDDELAASGVEYKSENIARGVDKILFKCPVCKKEGGITAEGNHIRCTCGLDATLDNFYRLHNAPFERINEWFEWQQNSIDTDNEVLKSQVRLGCCNECNGFMDSCAGEGEIYLDKNEFRLKGTLHGEEIDFTVNSCKIGAFPITPGDHFDIYHDGRLIYVYPEPDAKVTVKYVCFVDKLNSELKLKAHSL